MLSNHELPYVGRFACDWLRLATTDPDTVHSTMLRPAAAFAQSAEAERSASGPGLGVGAQ